MYSASLCSTNTETPELVGEYWTAAKTDGTRHLQSNSLDAWEKHPCLKFICSVGQSQSSTVPRRRVHLYRGQQGGPALGSISELRHISYSVSSTIMTLWPVSQSSVEQSESKSEPGSILYAYMWSWPNLTCHQAQLPSCTQSNAVISFKRLHHFVYERLDKDDESVCVAMLHRCPDSQTSSRASQIDLLNWILCLVYLHH